MTRKNMIKPTLKLVISENIEAQYKIQVLFYH